MGKAELLAVRANAAIGATRTTRRKVGPPACVLAITTLLSHSAAIIDVLQFPHNVLLRMEL